MSEFDDRLIADPPRKARVSQFRPVVWLVIPLIAILFQVYVPRFVQSLSYLELPLLVTVYFSLMRRQPIAGGLIGAAIGLAQDSLSQHPLGVFGIVMTLVGYFAASVSLRFDVENLALRFMLSFLFFLFHRFFFWLISRSLLGLEMDIELAQMVILGFLNAVVAIPLFFILDRLRTESR